jgi:hypothetical protein
VTVLEFNNSRAIYLSQQTIHGAEKQLLCNNQLGRHDKLIVAVSQIAYTSSTPNTTQYSTNQHKAIRKKFANMFQRPQETLRLQLKGL